MGNSQEIIFLENKKRQRSDIQKNCVFLGEKRNFSFEPRIPEGTGFQDLRNFSLRVNLCLCKVPNYATLA